MQERKILSFILGTGGIFFSYIILAIFAQKLYSTKYQSIVKFKKDGSPAEHRFIHPNLVVLLGTMFCAIFGFLKSHFTKERKNPISSQQSILSGLFYAINTTSTNFSLLYLSYPTQVISSSVRYLLVVLVGTYFSRLAMKSDLKIPKHKIQVAMFITMGVILFNVTKINTKLKSSSDGYFSQWRGYMFVLTSMIADSFFCDTQAYIKATYKPSVNHMFTATNFCAFLISLVYALATGCFFSGIKFILQHPSCLRQLFGVCILQVTGQVSIYYIIANFKQHIFPLISTTRKIFTIACSIMLFNHKLSFFQWIALCIIFAGMSFQVYEQVVKKKPGFYEFSKIQIVMEQEIKPIEQK